MAVVTSGADVGAKQSKPLQGHPAEHFSFIFVLEILSEKKYKYLFYKYHLTRAVELSCFESFQTIIFALVVALAVVNTSSKGQTVIVYASVPVFVLFHHLEINRIFSF